MDAFRLEIPSDITVLGVNAGGVQDWDVEPLEGEEGRSLLTVSLNFKAQQNFSFHVSFEKALGGTTVKTAIPDIAIRDVLRDRGTIAIAAATNVEITPEGKIENATPVDPSELPQTLGTGAGQTVLYAFKYLKHPVKVTLNVVKHDDLDVKRTIVESAQIVTFLSPEGKWITSARFRVKNNRKQYLSMTLPEDAKVWGAYLEDRPVKPALREDGAVLVPLKKTRLTSSGELEAFPVEVVYYQQGEKLWGVGSMDAVGPILDVDVLEANWEFFLPRDRYYYGFEGNLQEDALQNQVLYLGTTGYNMAVPKDRSMITTRSDSGRTYLSDGVNEMEMDELSIRSAGEDKEISPEDLRRLGPVGGKAASVEGYFGGVDGDQMEEMEGARRQVQQQRVEQLNEPMVSQYAMSNVAMDAQQLVGQGGAQAKGVLPVRIDIPREGLRLSFTGRLLTVGEAPKVEFRQGPLAMQNLKLALGWVVVLAFVFGLCLTFFAGKSLGSGGFRRVPVVLCVVLLIAVLLLGWQHWLGFLLALIAGCAVAYLAGMLFGGRGGEEEV